MPVRRCTLPLIQRQDTSMRSYDMGWSFEHVGATDRPDLPGEGRPRDTTLEGECCELGIPFVDNTQPLRVAATSCELPSFPDDTHLISCGNGILVLGLAPWGLGASKLRAPLAPDDHRRT